MKLPPHDAQYIGDGVYVYRDPLVAGLVWLITYNGVSTTDAIGLEPETLDGLLRWLDNHKVIL